jgi:hypothetical protein
MRALEGTIFALLANVMFFSFKHLHRKSVDLVCMFSAQLLK